MRHASSIAVGLVLALAVWLPARAAAPDQNPRYDLKADIEPAAGTIAVNGSIDLPATGPQLRFMLHRSFEITELKAGGSKASFAYEDAGPFPFVHTVVVTLPPGTSGKPLNVDIAYHGSLEKVPEWGTTPDQKFGMDDQINERLVYLALNSFWYPRLAPWGERFDTELEVSLPPRWTAISSGTVRELRARGRSVAHWTMIDNIDITVTASPSFRRIVAGRAELYYVRMPQDLVTAEAGNLSATVALFEKRLGATDIPGGVVRHVYAPLEYGQGRAGIARPGLIITSEGRVREAMAADPGYTLFQDVAHEIAHFWWNFGTGQGDWINESFAEYFSALAVRELVSKEKFDGVLAGYRNGVAKLPKDAPPLATVPAEGGDFNVIWTVRYQKGSLMLDAVRQTMGDEAFFRAARDFFQTYRGRGIGTAEFRAFWSARLGERKAMLDAWLDTGGPVLPQ